jgi:hypothetical protein
MPETLDWPVDLAQQSFDPVGLTVDAVVDRVSRTLRRLDIEPEWVSIANLMDSKDHNLYGLPSTARWPEAGSRQRRLCLSVERGSSEGWLVQTDFVQLVEDSAGMSWRSQPLMRVKTFNRSQAWTIAAIVARMLDID